MTDSPPYTPTPRTTLHRRPTRGAYDRATVHAILDEALVCTLAFVVEGQPFAIPTMFARDGEELFVHGAAASRMLKALAQGVPVCLTVSLLDGLVLARSAFHHSMNYRSVVVVGTATELTDRDAKLRAMACLVDKVSPGRANVARGPSDKEIAATRILSLPLVEVSAKVRSGGPIDDEEDMAFPVWAGVIPLKLKAAPEQPDTQTEHDVPALPPALR